MEKFQEMAVLLDIYGKLLTDKQRDVMDQYYNYDLSLQEIADNGGISKQGVHDLIRRSENTLIKTDEKLGFVKRLSDIRESLEKIDGQLMKLEDGLESPSDHGETAKAIIEACRLEIDRLINTCMGG
jgi:predicted DNA-binding protein YlxM (UPF0122 family)